MSNMLDAMKLFGRMGEIKDKIKEVKEELKFVKIVHESDDGLIKIYLDALKEIKKIELNSNMLTPDSKEDLEVRLVKEVNTAFKKADEVGKAKTKEALKGTLPDIPGLDLDNLPL